MQSRVTGACTVGQSIRAINVNGTVECEVDDDTVLLQAFKEQQVIVQRQAAENADLKARVERLERLLATGP